jgi:hypothetical protein
MNWEELKILVRKEVFPDLYKQSRTRPSLLKERVR